MTAQTQKANMLHLREAEALLRELGAYVGQLQGAKVEGTPSTLSNWLAVDFLERLPFVFPSVEVEAELDQYRTELRIDAEGHLLNVNGDPVGQIHTPAKRIEV